MSYVFISYSRKNSSIVSEVGSILKSSEMELWLDILGKAHGIPYSTKWFSIVEDALFRACGAVIFTSDDWDASVPCQEEYQLICQNYIPFIKIDLRNGQNVNQITHQIVEWHQETVDTEKNRIRTDLFTRVKDFQKNKSAYRTYPSSNQLLQFKIYAIENITDENSEVMKEISKYIKVAFKYKRMKTILRLIGSLIAIALFLMIQVNLSAFRALEEAEKKYLNISAGAVPILEEMRVNPYSTMHKLISETSIGNQAEFINSINLNVLNNLNYPVDYLEKNDPKIDKYIETDAKSHKTNSSEFAVHLSKTSGQVMLFNKHLKLSTQFVVSGIVVDYCWNLNGSTLALAAANKAYIYDTSSSNNQPIILDGNFENIKKVGWEGNRVFVISTYENVIVWDNPIQKPTKHRRLFYGKLFANTSEELCAVYISDGKLIYDRPQVEEIISLGVIGEIDDYIAISNNKTQIAVSYTPKTQTEERILIIDLVTQRIVSDYSIKCIPGEFIFSNDDKSLIIATFDCKGIAQLDLTRGQIAFSKSSDYQYYSIAATDDTYIISTTVGGLAIYDKNLNMLGDKEFNIFISGTNGNTPKNLCISQKFGFAFYTNNSGNKLLYNRRVTLKDHSLNIILTVPANKTEATSSVSVSDDGDFVAYGYPNGQIWVFDVKNLTALWSSTKIQEGIINLRFSSNNDQIFALGKSSTIYTLDTEGMIKTARTDEEVTNHWLRLVNKATKINESAYNLGISNIAPENFGHKQNNIK